MRNALLVMLLLVVGSAQAEPLTWTLNSVTTSDGASWTGTFDYDDVSNTYSAINIVSSVSGFANPVDTVSTDAFLTVGCTDPATADGVTLGFNSEGVTIFCMDFASSLSNIGGTVNLVTGGIGWGTLGVGETITGGSVSAPAAGPVKWTLNGVTTSDGASWTGSFHYDAVSNTYSAINIVSSVSGFANPVDTVSTDAFLVVGCTDPATASGATFGFNAEGVTIFCMDFLSPLTNSGGTVNLVTGDIGWGTLLVGETITGGSVTGVAFPGAIAADIEVIGAPLHVHHQGQGGLPDDIVSVAVVGTSTLLGDPEDLDATLIDPATLRFGPSEGLIDPASTPDLNYDHDGDGTPDAKFEFLMSETGFTFTPGAGDPCSASPATLVGESDGLQFTGTDSSVSTECDAQCHN